MAVVVGGDFSFFTFENNNLNNIITHTYEITCSVTLNNTINHLIVNY
jgi:hypothetical protein